jgi:site-specific DNA recombinase
MNNTIITRPSPAALQRAAVYARVSTSDQVRGTSLDSQVELCEQYAQANGYIVVTVVREDASGARLDRPRLLELRDMAERHEIEALIVFDPDRLSRSMAHTLMLLEEFERNRAEVLFVNAPREDTPEGQMLFGMRSLFAQYEREKIRERTRRGKERRIRDGQVMLSSSCSYGYEYIAAEKRIQVLEAEAVWVRKMFEWVAYEGCSLRQIAARLQAAGVPTKHSARAWHPGTIGQILSNEVYTGVWHYGKRREVEPKAPRKAERKHLKTTKEARPREEWLSVSVPAIVSQELFDAVAAQLARNQANSPRHTTNQYLFRGLLVCARCGYKMYGHTAKHRNPNHAPYEAYECPGKTRSPNRANLGRACNQPNVSLRRLETAVWDEVVRQLSDEGEFRRRIEEIAEANRRGRRDAETELEVITNLELGLKTETDKLLDLHLSDIIDKATLQERMAVIREKQAALTRSKAEVSARLTQWDLGPSSEEAIKQFCEIIRNGMPNATFEEKRALLEGMDVTLHLDGNRVTIVGLITEATLTVADAVGQAARTERAAHTPHTRQQAGGPDDRNPDLLRRSSRPPAYCCKKGT